VNDGEGARDRAGAAEGTVRPARPEDVPAILGLVRELADYEREPEAVVATERMFHEALFGPRPAVFAHVVEHRDGAVRAGEPAVVGMALWYLTFSTWLGRHGLWLEDLYVRPEHRGRGYGRLLLEELARVCVERGYGRLEWWVLDWNEPAQGFYRTRGGRPMEDWTVWRVDGHPLRRLAAGD
jgi:GNAT superfamily N-acetyltransferase